MINHVSQESATCITPRTALGFETLLLHFRRDVGSSVGQWELMEFENEWSGTDIPERSNDDECDERSVGARFVSKAITRR